MPFLAAIPAALGIAGGTAAASGAGAAGAAALGAGAGAGTAAALGAAGATGVGAGAALTPAEAALMFPGSAAGTTALAGSQPMAGATFGLGPMAMKASPGLMSSAMGWMKQNPMQALQMGGMLTGMLSPRGAQPTPAPPRPQGAPTPAPLPGPQAGGMGTQLPTLGPIPHMTFTPRPFDAQGMQPAQLRRMLAGIGM